LLREQLQKETPAHVLKGRVCGARLGVPGVSDAVKSGAANGVLPEINGDVEREASPP